VDQFGFEVLDGDVDHEGGKDVASGRTA
jgi:hypothetical protein